jgi:hypothetical protein
MKSCQSMFENQIIVKNITKSKVALRIEVKPNQITRYINEGREFKFKTACKIPGALFDGDESFLKLYACEVEKPENIPSSIEYLYANLHFNELSTVIARLEDMDSMRDWTSSYKLNIKYHNDRNAFNEVLSEISATLPNISDPAAQLNLHILKANIHLRTKDFGELERMIKLIESGTSDLKDSFIKDSFSCRCREFKAHLEMFLHINLAEARRYAEEIISENICSKRVSNGYYIIGTSYMLDNYEKSLENFQKSCDVLVRAGRPDLAKAIADQDITFLHTYWGKFLDDSRIICDEAENAHRLIKRGEQLKGIEILDNLPNTPFRTYFRAIANNDPMIHFRAIGEFIGKKDYFFARLSEKELENDPVYGTAVKNLLGR